MQSAECRIAVAGKALRDLFRLSPRRKCVVTGNTDNRGAVASVAEATKRVGYALRGVPSCRGCALRVRLLNEYKMQN